MADDRENSSAAESSGVLSEADIARVRKAIEALPPGMQRTVADLVRQGGTVETAMARLGPSRSIRRHSTLCIAGWPLYAVAMGPDAAHGESRGHARGVIALGDVATGVLAIGGWARGVVALGGAATGVVSFGGLAVGLASHGGLAIGLLYAIGGLAVSTYLAIGGVAVGYAAVGGLACGKFAAGGLPLGQFCVGPIQRSAEAVAFFKSLAAFDPTGKLAKIVR